MSPARSVGSPLSFKSAQSAHSWGSTSSSPRWQEAVGDADDQFASPPRPPPFGDADAHESATPLVPPRLLEVRSLTPSTDEQASPPPLDEQASPPPPDEQACPPPRRDADAHEPASPPTPPRLLEGRSLTPSPDEQGCPPPPDEQASPPHPDEQALAPPPPTPEATSAAAKTAARRWAQGARFIKFSSRYFQPRELLFTIDSATNELWWQERNALMFLRRHAVDLSMVVDIVFGQNTPTFQGWRRRYGVLESVSVSLLYVDRGNVLSLDLAMGVEDAGEFDLLVRWGWVSRGTGALSPHLTSTHRLGGVGGWVGRC